jgi:DNA-binding NarL/FixJ family response regulator
MSGLGHGGTILTIVVTDPDSMTARLLAADLRRQKQFDVIECPLTSHALQQCVAEKSPSVLLIGLDRRPLPKEWVGMLWDLRNRYPLTRTVVLLQHADRELISELFRSGVRGIFERARYDLTLLSRCIECVAEGEIWARNELLGYVLDAFVETAPPRVINATGEEMLTPREKDVVRLVADGFGNREIARQLGLSSHTIRNYLFNIFEKLGVSSRAELILYVLASASAGKSKPAQRISPKTGAPPEPLSRCG